MMHKVLGSNTTQFFLMCFVTADLCQNGSSFVSAGNFKEKTRSEHWVQSSCWIILATANKEDYTSSVMFHNFFFNFVYAENRGLIEVIFSFIFF